MNFKIIQLGMWGRGGGGGGGALGGELTGRHFRKHYLNVLFC